MERKKGNLTDIFRLFAAFAVVWYHNQYYGNVYQLNQNLLNIFLKYLSFFVVWSVPFFYVSSSRFALALSMREDGLKKQFRRVRNVIILIIVYILIYDLQRGLLNKLRSLLGHYLYVYTPFDLFQYGHSFPLIMKRVANVLQAVNTSPLYFLNHVIVIYICAICLSLCFSLTARINVKLRLAPTLIFLLFLAWAIIYPPAFFDAVRIHLLGIAGWLTIMLIGFGYYLLSIYIKIPKRYNAGGLEFLAVSGLTILIIGYLSISTGTTFYYKPILGYTLSRPGRCIFNI